MNRRLGIISVKSMKCVLALESKCIYSLFREFGYCLLSHWSLINRVNECDNWLLLHLLEEDTSWKGSVTFVIKGQLDQVCWVWLSWTAFSQSTLTVLCFLFVTKKVLITHQHFGFCWAVLAQNQRCLSNILAPISRLGVARSWEQTQPPQLTPTEQRYSIPCDIGSAIKTKREEEKEAGHSLFQCFFFQGNQDIQWRPTSQEVAGHHLLLEVENKYSFAASHNFWSCFY